VYLSESGGVRMGRFVIDESGIVSAGGAQQPLTQYNFKDESVRVEMLGQGASATVYLMVHVPTLTVVAGKVISLQEPSKCHLLESEFYALYRNLTPLVTHDAATGRIPCRAPCPHIVSFYGAFVAADEASLAFVMEYMDGGSLQDIVNTGGCSSESVLAKISYGVLKALEYIHARHIVHRDIKPSNILINHAGDVKVTDFGIVREMDDARDLAHTFVGTANYMSPERIAGLPYGYASDIWSFGLAILTAATGTFPYGDTTTYWELLSNLSEKPAPEPPADRFSPTFIDFIRLCLSKDPATRPSAATLLEHPFLRRVREVEAAAEAAEATAAGAVPPAAPSAAAPAADDGGHSGSHGSRAQLLEIARKVQKYRFLCAYSAGFTELPPIPSQYVCRVGRGGGGGRAPPPPPHANNTTPN